MKLVFVSGTQGSGKTSLVREVIMRLSKERRRSAVIVNEEGLVAYDQDFLQAYNTVVKSIRGG
jgi:G3E family GTPase